MTMLTVRSQGNTGATHGWISLHTEANAERAIRRGLGLPELKGDVDIWSETGALKERHNSISRGVEIPIKLYLVNPDI